MTPHQASFLLIGIAAILIMTTLAGAVAERLGQPRVIGEMAIGILCGPTLLGHAVSGAIFPVDTRPMLTALGNVGVAVFMFLVGLELDHRHVRRQSGAATTIALFSMAVPFGLGVGLAYLVDDRGVGFALFLGTAMAVTAFPVLARIMTDRGLNRTRIGGLALTCAAIGDIAAWAVLALVITMAGADADQWRLAFAVPYLLIMVFAVRPVLRRLTAARAPSASGLAIIMAVVSLSAAATEWMGLHFIFGAFLVGVLMPRTGTQQYRRTIDERVGAFGTTLLLPIFFVTSGLKVDLSGLTIGGFGLLSLILVTAVVGKFGGTYLGARLSRTPRWDAAILSTLMNTRGLTELIVLSVGLQLGILTIELYSLLVVMALVTTAMTGPLLTIMFRHQTPSNLNSHDTELADYTPRSAPSARRWMRRP